MCRALGEPAGASKPKGPEVQTEKQAPCGVCPSTVFTGTRTYCAQAGAGVLCPTLSSTHDGRGSLEAACQMP